MGQEKDSSRTPTGPITESLKDARDISNLLSILDASVLKTSPFGANISGENSYRRAERLTAALHLITNHVPEDEPLRTAVRVGGLDLLNLILDMRSGFRALPSEKGQAALAMIRRLITHVRLLAISGYVSAQNVNAIAEALDELGSLINVSQKSALAEQMTIGREDLTPPAMPAIFQKTNRPRQQRSTDVKDIKDGSRKTPPSGARSEQILEILRHGGTLGIKDVVANLPQYSEKMIQRELAVLVGAKRIRKMGEKRWSRYQIEQ